MVAAAAGQACKEEQNMKQAKDKTRQEERGAIKSKRNKNGRNEMSC
jgi:hypothetical protein